MKYLIHDDHHLVPAKEGMDFPTAKGKLLRAKMAILHDLEWQCGIARKAFERVVFLNESDVKKGAQ